MALIWRSDGVHFRQKHPMFRPLNAACFTMAGCYWEGILFSLFSRTTSLFRFFKALHHVFLIHSFNQKFTNTGVLFDHLKHSLWHHFDQLMQHHSIYFLPQLHHFFCQDPVLMMQQIPKILNCVKV